MKKMTLRCMCGRHNVCKVQINYAGRLMSGSLAAGTGVAAWLGGVWERGGRSNADGEGRKRGGAPLPAPVCAILPR